MQLEQQHVDAAHTPPTAMGQQAPEQPHGQPPAEQPPPAEQQPEHAPPHAAPPPPSVYEVKPITWNGGTVRIVLQNENGPCALIAVVNVLILRGDIMIHPDMAAVTFEYLVELIADKLFTSIPRDATDEYCANFQQNMLDVLAVLPKAQTGLDVNLKFDGVDMFEVTPELMLFDLVGIRLVHGWIVDPQDTETYAATRNLSYNQVVVKAMRADDAAFVLRNFLSQTASQLTFAGIAQLSERLREGELAVLFRNDHFATILKRRDELFCLATDSGFKHLPIVWETISNIENNGVFVDGFFMTYRAQAPADDRASPAMPMGMDDYRLAERLQDEELRRDPPGGVGTVSREQQMLLDEAMAREAQRKYDEEQLRRASAERHQHARQQSRQPQPQPQSLPQPQPQPQAYLRTYQNAQPRPPAPAQAQAQPARSDRDGFCLLM